MIPCALATSLAAAVLTAAVLTSMSFATASAALGREDSNSPPVSNAAHIDQVLDQTRLVFDLSAPVEAEAFVMADPDRVIVDLPEVNFQLDPRSGATQPRASRRRGAAAPKATTGVISSYRFGLFAPGKSRIVIDLAKPARVVRAVTEAGPDGRHRLQIDLAPTDAATFRRTARAAVRDFAVDAPAAPPRPEAQAAGDTRPLVVIDPGHGGIDSGAQGLGAVIEKTLVFDFSKILEGQLQQTGKYRVLMTRNADVFVSLADRVKFARDANAALFISIHADTISEAAGVSGATVYTVSDKASDAQAAKLAEKENDADSAAGLGGAEDGADVSDILFDLTRRETRAYSHVFARSLVSYWSQAGRLNKNPMRSAGFLVLKAPDVPSVLLELGYLSSEKDMAALMKPQWREKAAGAIVESVDKFFAPRIGAGERPADVPPDGVAVAQPEPRR